MAPITTGQPAPPVRLPSAQGGDVALEDHLRHGPAIVWFTKGMGCSFCRAHMSQLARSHDRIKARGAEVLQVTPSTPERARFYAQHYRLPFPYLCDPDWSAHRAWGLDVRPGSLGHYARAFVAGMRTPPPPNDLGPGKPSFLGSGKPSFGELPTILQDSDMGFFVVDRMGVVRYSATGTYVVPAPAGAPGVIAARPLPTEEEILRVLDACA